MNGCNLPLTLVEEHIDVEVIEVNGTENVSKRLIEMGFNIGETLSVVQSSKGSLIVKVKETKLILGKSMAQKIIVKMKN